MPTTDKDDTHNRIEAGYETGWRRTSMHGRAKPVLDPLAILTCLLIVAVPLIATPLEPQVPGLTAMTFYGFAILLFMGLVGRAKWSLRGADIRTFLRTGVNSPLLLYLGWCAVSCILSPQKTVSLAGLLRTGAGAVVYFTLVYTFRRTEMLARLVDALLLVGIVSALVGFVQFGNSQEHFATGLQGDHQLFGSLLMALLPVLAVTAIAERNPTRHIAAQAAAILVAACLLLTHARSAWVGGAAGLAATGLLALGLGLANRAHRRHKQAPPRSEVLIPAVLLLVALGFFLLFSPQTGSILERMTSFSRLQNDGTWQTRMPYWHAAIEMVKDHPVVGVGLNRFPYVLGEYSTIGAPINQTGMRPSLGELAHDVPLQTAAELGLPGLALLAVLVVSFLVSGVLRVRKMEPGIRRSLLIGSCGGLLAFGVDGLASPSWQFSGNLLFFWVLLGLGVACIRPLPKEEGRRSRRTPEESAPHKQRLLLERSVAVLLGLCLAALLPKTALADPSPYHQIAASVALRVETVRRGRDTEQICTLLVTFKNSAQGPQSARQTRDCSDSPNVRFTQTGGRGTLSGTNNRIYHVPPGIGPRDRPVFTGTYRQGDFSLSAVAEGK